MVSTMMFHPAFLLAFTLLPSANARLFTVVNLCSFTIWPAIYTNLSASQNTPSFPTGWESPPYTSTQFAVPDNWASGRIWGRRNCNFTSNSGPSACLDGGCNGGIQCDPNNGTIAPPVTMAEWTLGSGGTDKYDVSLVNGFNLPMMIIPSAGSCSPASCSADLNPGCPTQLIGARNSSGNPAGCNSACTANLDNASNSSNCCTGSHNTASTCPASGVQYYSYFKGSCPNSTVYEFDQSSGNALWNCSSSQNSDYRLTFCPPPYGGQSPAPISAVPASLIPTGTSSSTGTSNPSGTSPAGAPSASRKPNSTLPSGVLVLLHVMAPWALLSSCAAISWMLVL